MSSRIVRADEDLFDRWRALGRQIADLAAIVQNDVEIADQSPLLE